MLDTPTSWRIAGTGLAVLMCGVLALVLVMAITGGVAASIVGPAAQLIGAVITFGWILVVAGLMALGLGGYLIYQETR
ncbi:MAG TPA: hypothetical protein PLA44_14030 [Propionibacteriaceae bacterium]|nr:hypothetical protein [Propionibacteriaceae bacterium]